MAEKYNIYLVNKSGSTRNFWLFLQPPEQMKADPGVFANSSACLSIINNAQGYNLFTVPVQYSVAAGASNEAVGLDVAITSNVPMLATLGKQYEADYVTCPPRQGPQLKEVGAGSSGLIDIVTNNFNKPGNEDHGWFANQSFGIQTAAGYIGMTWSPDPGVTRHIQPKFSFYVSTGDFDYNTLAQWTDVSTKAAEISLDKFSQFNCTVTLTETGDWTVTPGKPVVNVADDVVHALVSSHQSLCKAHENLLALTQSAPLQQLQLEGDPTFLDTVSSVVWQDNAVDGMVQSDMAYTFLKGRLSVGSALMAGFTFFLLSGVRFNIKGSTQQGSFQCEFDYSGDRSAKAVQDLFKPGAPLEFHK